MSVPGWVFAAAGAVLAVTGAAIFVIGLGDSPDPAVPEPPAPTVTTTVPAVPVRPVAEAIPQVPVTGAVAHVLAAVPDRAAQHLWAAYTPWADPDPDSVLDVEEAVGGLREAAGAAQWLALLARSLTHPDEDAAPSDMALKTGLVSSSAGMVAAASATVDSFVAGRSDDMGTHMGDFRRAAGETRDLIGELVDAGYRLPAGWRSGLPDCCSPVVSDREAGAALTAVWVREHLIDRAGRIQISGGGSDWAAAEWGRAETAAAGMLITAAASHGTDQRLLLQSVADTARSLAAGRGDTEQFAAAATALLAAAVPAPPPTTQTPADWKLPVTVADVAAVTAAVTAAEREWAASGEPVAQVAAAAVETLSGMIASLSAWDTDDASAAIRAMRAATVGVSLIEEGGSFLDGLERFVRFRTAAAAASAALGAVDQETARTVRWAAAAAVLADTPTADTAAPPPPDGLAARFGSSDPPADGCDTAAAFLSAVSLVPVACPPTGNGKWLSPFDGAAVSGSVTVAHVVPLPVVWASGGHEWDDDTWRRHIRDTAGLAVTSHESATARSGRSIEAWHPEGGGLCWYAARWLAVKARWGLSVTEPERGFLRSVLAGECEGLLTAARPRPSTA